MKVIHRAAQVVVYEEAVLERGYASGDEMGKSVRVLEGHSVVISASGRIEAIVSGEEAEAYAQRAEQVIDARGCSVVPGLVDGHTHPVWAGDRVHEFALKLSGASYMDIHRSGGGIGFTVRHTDAAGEEELYSLLFDRLCAMGRQGTTLVECKTGYGLHWEAEAKMLRVLDRAAAVSNDVASPLPGLVLTYLGAHSVPSGGTAQAAARDVVDRQLPNLAALRQQGLTACENVDVFYERGVFEREETHAILSAASSLGFTLNFHGDELHAMGSGELAAELGARAVSHCEQLNADDRRAMAEKGVAAVLLPTTAYVLRIPPPDARALIAAGVPVALGSDFNPNAYCLSMPHVMNLACVFMRMSLEEALLAATLNAAYSLGRHRDHGAISVGRAADLLILSTPRWEHLIYRMAAAPISMVLKSGVVLFQSK